ncbi:MAG: hypothetical protein HQL07_17175 [Nitrospirae bacterium]|nr:hypothetical protein [Magnetococcales bacterium]HAT48982.1 hypothetical protein [Alphaproteobacteria bacterium]
MSMTSILTHPFAGRSHRHWRHWYWAMVDHAVRWNRLLRSRDSEFKSLVWQDQLRFILGSPIAVNGETAIRAYEALQWLFRGQDATPDDGVSMGYFPMAPHADPWRPSYPETTGYIIVTLLAYGKLFQDTQAIDRGWAMGRWEVQVQMESGAVQGGVLASANDRKPAVFNTGMVLQGWVTLLEHRWDDSVAQAAIRAADFLLADQAEDGHFCTHGPFVAQDRIKTYNVLCAWPLMRLGRLLNHDGYRDAALKAARAAMAMQRDNGWFAYNDLTRPEMPLTHTLGYTLQGLLEIGNLVEDAAMIAAVTRGLGPILAQVDPWGFLHGRFDDRWRPSGFSSCLTGSAQIAIVAYRMYQITGMMTYRNTADRIVNFLKGLQNITTQHPGIRGALAGSYPMFLGSYMTAGYPNWATKYFLDALMLQSVLAE